MDWLPLFRSLAPYDDHAEAKNIPKRHSHSVLWPIGLGQPRQVPATTRRWQSSLLLGRVWPTSLFSTWLAFGSVLFRTKSHVEHVRSFFRGSVDHLESLLIVESRILTQRPTLETTVHTPKDPCAQGLARFKGILYWDV